MKLTKNYWNNGVLIYEYSVSSLDKEDIVSKLMLDKNLIDKLGKYLDENSVLLIQNNFKYNLRVDGKELLSYEITDILNKENETVSSEKLEDDTNTIDKDNDKTENEEDNSSDSKFKSIFKKK